MRNVDPRLSVVQGDITVQDVDAIVNAANSSLLGGGGVDGAIHRAAGSGLLEECRLLGGCPTGKARITGGYGLPAGHVIHTVGPVWHGGDRDEEALLASCYRESLHVGRLNGIQSIAFPAISCGAYGFPADRAAAVAIREVGRFLATDESYREVRFVCYDAGTYRVFEKTCGLM